MADDFTTDYRAPGEGMLHAAALVQDWSIAVLDEVQNLHWERCTEVGPSCPIDQFDYPSAIEAAGVYIRNMIEAYADRWVDAPVLAAHTEPVEVASAMFLDMDEWMELAAERRSVTRLERQRMRDSLQESNQKARERWAGSRRRP